MKQAHILHNPKSGKETYTKKELVGLIEKHGFACGYSSTKKKGWKKLHPETDFLIIAGGDGTVRKVTVELLHRKKSARKFPLVLLPLGTANNIAKSLGLEGKIKDILTGIRSGNHKAYDIGKVSGLEEPMIFLESFGYGIFPRLMQQMKEKPAPEGTAPEKEIQYAQKTLKDIVNGYPAMMLKVKIDGVEYSGQYLMAEVMNTESMGPNLRLSPDADPGDGMFEVILVPESQRQALAEHLSEKIKGNEHPFLPVVIRGKKISILSTSLDMHTDDEVIPVKKSSTIKISLKPAMLRFIAQG